MHSYCIKAGNPNKQRKSSLESRRPCDDDLIYTLGDRGFPGDLYRANGVFEDQATKPTINKQVAYRCIFVVLEALKKQLHFVQDLPLCTYHMNTGNMKPQTAVANPL